MDETYRDLSYETYCLITGKEKNRQSKFRYYRVCKLIAWIEMYDVWMRHFEEAPANIFTHEKPSGALPDRQERRDELNFDDE